MAKDKSLSKEERKAAKKEKLASESAGISKPKSDKKEKKEKKEKKAKLAEKLLANGEQDAAVVVKKNDGEVVSDEEMENGTDGKAVRLIGALVPFANPLADEKVAKKVFRGVKKGMF